MKIDHNRRWKLFAVAGAAMALVAGMATTVPNTYAAGTIKADDDKWISIGMGTRTSFNMSRRWVGERCTVEQRLWRRSTLVSISTGRSTSTSGFEFNTECFNCPRSGQAAGPPTSNTFGSNSSVGVLDMIGKFEINEPVNVWFGRMLVPTERGELNGPVLPRGLRWFSDAA